MFAVFCLRLAFGLLLSLWLLFSFPINPRFYRAHFLTALGLLVGAAILLITNETQPLAWWWLLPAIVLCILGSIIWHLENSPGGKLWIILATVCAGFNLVQYNWENTTPLLIADNMTSALFLGSATTAMLLGHSYLMAPTMTIRPLLRILWALGACLLLRLLLALWGLWMWTGDHSLDSLEMETALWLSVRWGIGFLIPAVLVWLTYETARIRSTQSATGILYVVVIVCFLGELTSQLLLDKTKILL